MKRLLCMAALGAAFLLAGCGLDAQKTDAALSSDTGQTVYAISCATVNVLSAGYDAYVGAHPDKVSEKAQGYIALAKAALVATDGSSNICTPPYPKDVASLSQKLTDALINVYKAYAEQGLDPKVTIAAADPEPTESPPAQ